MKKLVGHGKERVSPGASNHKYEFIGNDVANAFRLLWDDSNTVEDVWQVGSANAISY